MPTYQYACTACNHSFDAVQSFSEDSLTVCPECTGRLRKVYANVGVVFKGSGFYRNDSRALERNGSGKESSETSADKSAAKDPAGKDAGSKDKASKDTGSKEPVGAGTKSPVGAGSAASGATAKGPGPQGRGRPTPSTGSGNAA